MPGQEQSWWAIRMVVELTESQFEDRIILVTASTEEQARTKGEKFAGDYQQTTEWVVRKIVDVSEVLDKELQDGVEVYSAFIDDEWAQVLIKGGTSPAAEWKKKNPDKDIDDATVGEINDAWESRPQEP